MELAFMIKFIKNIFNKTEITALFSMPENEPQASQKEKNSIFLCKSHLEF